MKLNVIATGSTGNAYLLDTGSHRLLLDGGLRWPVLLRSLGHDLDKLCAALITHEHGDHGAAAHSLAKAGIPLYMSAGTADALDLRGHHRVTCPPMGSMFAVGPWSVLTFPTQHDAAEPVGFLVRYNPTGETLIYATDTYYLRFRPQRVNYYLVECNYCVDTLESSIASGRVPEEMRGRLMRSHFALHNLIGFLRAADLSHARQIVLLHMSDNNSDEERMVREVAAATRVPTVAARAGLALNLELTPF